MNFTSTPPTELGAYWWKEEEYHQPKVVTIEQTPYIQGLAAVLGDAVYEIDNFPKGLWSPPLVPKTPDCRWVKNHPLFGWRTTCGKEDGSFNYRWVKLDPDSLNVFCPFCGGRIITS